MAVTFAFAETRGGELRKVAFEAVTAARQAADASGGGEVHALVLGAPGIASKAEALGRYGADVIVVVEHAGLERYNPEVAAATAAERLRAGQYRAAFFSASAEGRALRLMMSEPGADAPAQSVAGIAEPHRVFRTMAEIEVIVTGHRRVDLTHDDGVSRVLRHEVCQFIGMHQRFAEVCLQRRIALFH